MLKTRLFQLLLFTAFFIVKMTAQDVDGRKFAFLDKKYKSAYFKEASESSKELGILTRYDVIELDKNRPSYTNFIPCIYDDPFDPSGSSLVGYANPNAFTYLKDSPIKKEQFGTGKLNLMCYETMSYDGELTIGFNGDEFSGSYKIFLRNPKEGENPILKSAEFKGIYNNGHLAIYENDTPIIYDGRYGVLMIGGYLWDFENNPSTLREKDKEYVRRVREREAKKQTKEIVTSGNPESDMQIKMREFRRKHPQLSILTWDPYYYYDLTELQPIGEQKNFLADYGDYLSVYMEDEDNYVWFYTPMVNDRITGEKKLSSYKYPFAADKIRAAKRKFDNYTIISKPDTVQIIRDGLYPMNIIISNVKNGGGFLRCKTEADVANLIRDYIPNAVKTQNIKFATLYSDNYEPYNHNNDWGFLSDDKKEYIFFIKWIRNNDNAPCIVKRIILGDIEGKDHITLMPEDVIRSIEQNGNIITMKLNDDDYIKYSLYANAIYEGKLKRKTGTFTFTDKNLEDNYISGVFTTSVDRETPFWSKTTDFYVTECIIPAGSKIIACQSPSELRYTLPGNILMYDDPLTSLIDSRGVRCLIYNSEDKQTHIINYGRTYWVNGDKVEAERQKKKKAELAVKQKVIFDKLAAKYGARYVKGVMDGKLLIGTPLGLVKEVFEHDEWSNSGNHYKVYKVAIRPALYNEELNKITAKREANMFYPYTFVLVSFSNDRVSSVTYL